MMTKLRLLHKRQRLMLAHYSRLVVVHYLLDQALHLLLR